MNERQLAGLMMGEKVVVIGYGDSRYDGRTATVQRTTLDMVLVCFEGSGSEYGFPSRFIKEAQQ